MEAPTCYICRLVKRAARRAGCARSWPPPLRPFDAGSRRAGNAGGWVRQPRDHAGGRLEID